MSQIYRVQLSSSLTRTLTAHDEMTHAIELTPIFEEEAMRDLVRDVLRREGWEERDDGTFTRTGPSGESLVWDVEGGVVTASLAAERTVEVTVTAAGQGESDRAAQEEAERAIDRRSARVAQDMDDAAIDLERGLSHQLESTEPARRRVLNGVVERVYADALERKARQLGTVLSVEEHENEGSYELTIHIAES